jgi:hypothetical protein
VAETSPRAQLSSFISKFSPPIAARARAVLATLRTRLPGATELVYDNYNALAIGFGTSERMSDLIVSVAVYPRWVSLFFFNPQDLDDPERLLKGNGTMVRHLVLDAAGDLERPAVRALLRQAVAVADVPLDTRQPRQLVIKSVSARQRPRRLALAPKVGARASQARRLPARPVSGRG